MGPNQIALILLADPGLVKRAQGYHPLGSPMMASIDPSAPLGEVVSIGDTFHLGTASPTQPLGLHTPKRTRLPRNHPLEVLIRSLEEMEHHSRRR